MSADGTRVVSGGWDTTLRVWDAQSGRCLRVLRGHDGHRSTRWPSAPTGACWSRPGWDRTVRVWDVDQRPLPAHLRRPRRHRLQRGAERRRATGGVGAAGTRRRACGALPALRSRRPIAPRLSRRVTYARLPSGEPDADELLDVAEEALRERQLGEALAGRACARAPRPARAEPAASPRCGGAGAELCPRAGVRALVEQASLERRAARHRPSGAAGRAGSWRRCRAARCACGIPTSSASSARSTGTRRAPARWPIGAQLAVSAGADASVRVWDLAGGAAVHVLDGHTSIVAARGAERRRAARPSPAATTTPCACGTSRAAAASGCSSGHARQVTAVAFDPPDARRLRRLRRRGARSGICGDGQCLTCCGTARRRAVPAHGRRTVPRSPPCASAPTVRSPSRPAPTARCAAGAPTAALPPPSRRITAPPFLDADLSADGRWALCRSTPTGRACVWYAARARSRPPPSPSALPLAHARILLDAGRLAAIEPNGRAHLYEVDWELAAPGA